MKDAILEALHSKKFLALCIGVVALFVVAVLKGFGFDGVGEDQVKYLLGLLASYIIGQGIADKGKEAAMVNAKSAESMLALSAEESEDPEVQ